MSVVEILPQVVKRRGLSLVIRFRPMDGRNIKIKRKRCENNDTEQ